MTLVTTKILSFCVAIGAWHATSAAAGPLMDKLPILTASNAPGVAYMVVRDGRVVEQKVYGHATLVPPVAIDARTNFNLASNSKAFTALAILLLESDPALLFSADDEVRRYIPELPDYARNVRVRHLIHHTSGMPSYMSACDADGRVTNRGAIEALRRPGMQLLFPAGSTYDYSNTGYVLLAEIVERVSGQSFASFVKTRILDKLEMSDTRIISIDDDRDTPRRANAYSAWPFFTRLDDDPCDYVQGDGGVVTSLDDYAKWTRALSSPGFLKAEQLKKIFTSGALDSGELVGYGYGWGVDLVDGDLVVSHSGSWTGYKSSTIYLPQDKTWYVLLSNYEATPAGKLLQEIIMEHSSPGR